MLKKYFSGLAFFLVTYLIAQEPGYLVIISNNDQPVRVEINDVPVNHKPVNHLKIGPMAPGYYRVDVFFQFGNIEKRLTEKLYVAPASEIVYTVYPSVPAGQEKHFIVEDIYPAGNTSAYGSLPLYPVNFSHPPVSQQTRVEVNIQNNIHTAPVAQTVYTGATGCPAPVSYERFQSMLNTVENESFDEGRLRIAKILIQTNACLSAAQVKQLMQLFSFDDNKVELAKFAWDYLYDLENFHLIYDALDFESSKEELENYIQNHPY